MEKIVKIEELEKILTKCWTSFIDSKLLLKKVLEDANLIASPNIVHDKKVNFNRKLQISITEFTYKQDSTFDVCVEFSIPKEKGILFGNHYYSLNLDGYLFLENSSGTLFLNDI